MAGDHLMLRLLVATALLCGLVTAQDNYMYGLMKLTRQGEVGGSTPETQDNTTREYCFFYNSDLFQLPNEPNKLYKMVDATAANICGGGQVTQPTDRGNGTLFLMERETNCTFTDYIEYAKEHHGIGFFLNLYQRQKLNETHGMDIFGAIENTTLDELKEFLAGKGDVSVEIHSYPFNDSYFGGSIVFLWLTACFCVAVGSLTGPYQDLQSTSSRQQILEGSSTNSSSSASAKNVQISFSVTLVLTLVVFITATLLLLYFFYDYLVFFFMAIFCFASGRATYEILNQIAKLMKMDTCFPRIKGCGLHRIFLAALCIALPVLWFVFRHHTNIWILQDLLGICFCIHIIQTLRIPNLQICTVLLTLLFVYDIFFVFVTPYFTSNGKSVMVEVATGGGSGESLPLLIKFPRANGPAVCNFVQSYSLLGFGDVIVPGFLVCFAHSFDIIRGDKFRPYFIVAMIGYMIGLAIAFLALFISQTGQPALLYIVPCTLITIIVTGLMRKQFRDLWRGSITITEVEP